MAKDKNAGMVNALEALFQILLEEAGSAIMDADGEASDGEVAPEGQAPISFLDRIKLFEAGTRWVAVKNRVDPEGVSDEWSELSRKYHGGARGRRAANAAETAAPAAGNGRAS